MIREPEDEETRDLWHEELQRQKLRRRYAGRLMRHPDCRDPDHPGCERCRDDDEEE